MRSRIRTANRREFLKAAVATGVACPCIVTSAALGTADRALASERIVVGGTGIGGQGGFDMKTFLGREKLCHFLGDALPPIVDGRIGLRHMYTRGARYRDFRVSVPAQLAN